MKSISKKSPFLSQMMLVLVFGCVSVLAQTTEFSYQGFLNDTSASANGNYDFEFRYFNTATGGTPLATQQRSNILVTNGVFSIVLDFGQVIPLTETSLGGNDYYLEISVRPSGGGAFTTLAPRSKLLSTPFSTSSKFRS